MPVMSGWVFLAMIKGYTRLSQIPVVVLSGVEARLEPGRDGAIAAFLRKPYDLDELLALAAKHAGDQRPTGEESLGGPPLVHRRRNSVNDPRPSLRSREARRRGIPGGMVRRSNEAGPQDRPRSIGAISTAVH